MKNSLSPKEVALIKGIMKYHPKYDDQTILNRFSIAERTVNAGRISEIRTGKKHKNVAVASKQEVEDFVKGLKNVHHYLQQLPLGQNLFLFGDVEYSPSEMKTVTNEGKNIEFKEIFENSKAQDYLKILIAMANTGTKNGKIIFGIKNNKTILGCSGSVDIDQITNISKDYFEPFLGVISDKQMVSGKTLIRIGFNEEEIPLLPILCKKDHKNISNGEIYYRYGSLTELIKYAELINIIHERINRAVNDTRIK